MKSNLVDLSVLFQHRTEKAVCVRETEDGEHVWIPRSRCEIDPPDPSRGQVVTLTTDKTTATEKGLV